MTAVGRPVGGPTVEDLAWERRWERAGRPRRPGDEVSSPSLISATHKLANFATTLRCGRTSSGRYWQ